MSNLQHDHQQGHCHGHTHFPGLNCLGDKLELVFAGIAAACLILGWLAGHSAWVYSSTIPAWIPLSLYATSYFFGGYFALIDSLQSLRRARLEIDLLMIVAAAGAGAIGHRAEGALLLTLFSTGHALEHYAMGRARKSIEALGRLRPDSAIVLRSGVEATIPIDQIEIGDRVIVPPDSIIAIDGVVIDGESGVDQAPITGESVPVDKFPSTEFEPGITDSATVAAEQKVFAGTINGPGALKVYVTRKSADSTLSKLMRMVTEAESQRSPTQRLTDKFERYFVPAVLIFVLLLLMVWLVVDEPFSQSFYRAMAVLVGASPCALAIATPSAVLSGVARGGHRGVLFKGGGPLELLGRVDQIAFDKTGTLTTGKPHLTDVVPMAGVDEVKLLQVAAAVERLSAHPIARAIWLAAKERLGDRPIPPATEFRSITGRGVTAILNNELVAIGSESLFQKTLVQESQDSLSAGLPSSLKSEIDRLRTAGRTIMIVKQGDHFLGVLGMLDTARETARPTISRLRSMGIRRMVMLSGDHQVVADAIAAGVGLDDARGDLMPEDKVSAMKDLTRQSFTAMVGDGVNDAPAMATASVAIAMGAAGSDVAMETADVALMGDDLSRLPFAIGLSRQTARIIRQNLWISLGVVAILIPAGLLGLNLAAAVVFHEGSTVVVVLNALRLLAYKNPES